MFRMTVAEVIVLRNRGPVAAGTIEHGIVRVGDHVIVNGRQVRVEALERDGEELDAASEGETVGLLLAELAPAEVASGDVISTEEGWPLH